MKSILIKGTAAVAVVASMLVAASHYSAIPEVHVSHSAGECVRVINHGDTNFTCEDQPRKYHHVWVK